MQIKRKAWLIIMKKRMIMVILSAVLTAGVISGCGQAGDQGTEAPVQDGGQTTDPSEDQVSNEAAETEAADQSEMESTAMYVPITETAYIFVDQETNTVFTVTFPEEMYDIDGNKITKEDLTKGNIVKLYGNGIMLESYPGQYPGISRMEVIEEGSPADADRYQTIVDEIYQEPDPAEPPAMNVEYTTELAVATVMVNRGGYEWTYVDKDGLSNSVVADGIHVLRWGDALVDISLEEPLDMTLCFSEPPVQVEAARYDSALIGTDSLAEAEAVEVEEKDGNYIIPQTEGGYVYEITGTWENGSAVYGFLTVEMAH